MTTKHVVLAALAALFVLTLFLTALRVRQGRWKRSTLMWLCASVWFALGLENIIVKHDGFGLIQIGLGILYMVGEARRRRREEYSLAIGNMFGPTNLRLP
jgi:hypothetical protein